MWAHLKVVNGIRKVWGCKPRADGEGAQANVDAKAQLTHHHRSHRGILKVRFRVSLYRISRVEREWVCFVGEGLFNLRVPVIHRRGIARATKCM